MAEALGTIASVLQLVDTALKARKYLKDFHNAAKEQHKLFSEMENVMALLEELNRRAEKNLSGDTILKMAGPLNSFKTTMEHLTKKLPLNNGLSEFNTRLTWTLWSKKEVMGYIEELERIIGLITLWLTLDICRDRGQKQIANETSILKGVQDYIDDSAQLVKAEKRQTILEWMSPLNFLQRQADVFNTLQPGTGEWLLAEHQFQDWESGSGEILLCQGMPGAGKTVLASLVVHYLEPRALSHNIGLACIYLNHKETGTQTLTNLLGGLWRQLMLGKGISPTVHSLYGYHYERQTRPNLDEFGKALNLAIAEYPKVYFVIDALDEYPEPLRHLLLKNLVTLVPHVNLLFTSRPHINLDSYFPHLQMLEIYATAGDIHRYLDIQIQNSVRLSRHIRTQPALCEEISCKIIENAKGMFLLAKLHIECLTTKNTIKAVGEAMQNLPNDLQHTYDEAMARINHQTEEDKQLGLLVLTWVANAKRPLAVAELQDALAVEPESTSLNVENYLNIDIILSVCAGLITVDDTTSTVRLIHYTTQNYLDSIQLAQFPMAQTIILSTCLTYLSFKEFDVLPESKRAMILDHPLLEYAQYCLLHAKGQPEIPLQDRILDFLHQSFKWVGVWYGPSPWNLPERSYFTPLGISAACNLCTIARYLLAKGIPAKIKDVALCIASCYGHIPMVQLLIDEGGNVNAAEVHFGHTLQAASWGGHESVVRLLIEKGADLNKQGGTFGNALQAASWCGHKIVVQLLIEQGADVTAQGGEFRNALQAAASIGHWQVVQLLIEEGATTHQMEGGAIQMAAMRGHEAVVELFIKNGADVNAQGGPLGNALQAASSHGHETVVQLLIEMGANVNAQGGFLGNALQAAVSAGQEALIKLLIKKGSNLNAQGGHYGNALQAASWNGHKGLVQLLIEQGADVNAQGGHYGNALHAASCAGHHFVVRLLITKGADVNKHGGMYGNALQAGSWGGDERVVQLLIENGADVNAQGGYYGKPLQAASAEGNELVIKKLIEKGAEVNAQGGHYGSSLQAASCNSHESVVHLLMKNGANVNAQGGLYGNALCAASAKGHIPIVQLLIDGGANVNSRVGQYETALEAASAKHNKHVVELLIEHGADTNLLQTMLTDIPSWLRDF
ncbi:ankyrin repeat-containing domain protein [Mycena rosella]|uniref:Ankyrin repeat-containing domain protein n=1 Tax=Mycena rosella TaxID=1033263 RepID=A0AAD7DCN2_MYCRO|nr:ankyrin repeat-containing domain protein [Mycena rosella]